MSSTRHVSSSSAAPSSAPASHAASEVIAVVSPIDGSIYTELRLASGAEIEATLAAAASAQGAWRRTPIAERAAICRRASEAMVARADEIGTELTWQMGRPVAYSPFEIRRGFQERARFMIDTAEQALADIAVEPKADFQRFIRLEPLGVVLVLAPWNYPYLASVNAVIPALMAGNSVILKIAPQTPRVADRYAQAFREAGLPDGVFQVLHVTHDDVARIVTDARVSGVAFTGSVPGGQAVQQAAAAAGRFIACNLELGGKDPAYVRADAPLDAAIENLVDGSYFNSGQSCCAVERIYVQREIYTPFVDGFVALTRQYRLGNPLAADTTLGPMVRTAAADAARAQVDEALAQGARSLVDPAAFAADRAGTPYMAPRVLVDVTHDMRVMTEETFGPVVGIMAVEDDDEAVARMNDSRYGLTASIWTDDVDAALRIGDRIDTGTWFMNRCDYLDPALAWTGVKASGRGCSLSVRGYDAFTRPKSFHLRLRV